MLCADGPGPLDTRRSIEDNFISTGRRCPPTTYVHRTRLPPSSWLITSGAQPSVRLSIASGKPRTCVSCVNDCNAVRIEPAPVVGRQICTDNAA
ncbi:hypothetical protein VTN02DRAFT_3074 [Thermoascus thermophilus]